MGIGHVAMLILILIFNFIVQRACRPAHFQNFNFFFFFFSFSICNLEKNVFFVGVVVLARERSDGVETRTATRHSRI
jgi:hypothetical protein